MNSGNVRFTVIATRTGGERVGMQSPPTLYHNVQKQRIRSAYSLHLASMRYDVHKQRERTLSEMGKHHLKFGGERESHRNSN